MKFLYDAKKNIDLQQKGCVGCFENTNELNYPNKSNPIYEIYVKSAV